MSLCRTRTLPNHTRLDQEENGMKAFTAREAEGVAVSEEGAIDLAVYQYAPAWMADAHAPDE